MAYHVSCDVAFAAKARFLPNKEFRLSRSHGASSTSRLADCCQTSVLIDHFFGGMFRVCFAGMFRVCFGGYVSPTPTSGLLLELSPLKNAQAHILQRYN